jgi:hypothetical protein
VLRILGLDETASARRGWGCGDMHVGSRMVICLYGVVEAASD